MARGANEQETKGLELSVPVELHAYLVHLAKHSPLGANPNDVARFILTEAVKRMMGEGYPPKHPY